MQRWQRRKKHFRPLRLEYSSRSLKLLPLSQHPSRTSWINQFPPSLRAESSPDHPFLLQRALDLRLFVMEYYHGNHRRYSGRPSSASKSISQLLRKRIRHISPRLNSELSGVLSLRHLPPKSLGSLRDRQNLPSLPVMASSREVQPPSSRLPY